MTVLTDRFWSKVSKPDGDAGCWEWAGALNSRGYGQWGVLGVSKSTHRLAYQAIVGPIPDGMVIDHLCRVRRCCNPAHLEVVTNAENVRRGEAATKSHCIHGHLLDESNTIVRRRSNGSTYRNCRTCQVESAARHRAKRAA